MLLSGRLKSCLVSLQIISRTLALWVPLPFGPAGSPAPWGCTGMKSESCPCAFKITLDLVVGLFLLCTGWVELTDAGNLWDKFSPKPLQLKGLVRGGIGSKAAVCSMWWCKVLTGVLNYGEGTGGCLVTLAIFQWVCRASYCLMPFQHLDVDWDGMLSDNTTSDATRANFSLPKIH